MVAGGLCRVGLAVDVLGLIIAMVVAAASATDNTIGVTLINQVVAHTPTVSKACRSSAAATDSGSCQSRAEGSSSRPRATLMLHRRLTCEYQSTPAS